MEDQFVPYVLALKLKELGFNEKCLRLYINESLGIKPYDESNRIILAPLWQQAFDWFRLEYNLHSELVWDIIDSKLVWFYSISEISNITDDGIDLSYMDSVKKANIACLDKLIEIIEQQKTK